MSDFGQGDADLVFTPAQIAAVMRCVGEHGAMQHLLDTVVRQDHELEALKARLDALEKALDADVPPTTEAQLTGATFCMTPVATLTLVYHAVMRYMEMTGNLGDGAQRMPNGDIVIDLEHPELRQLLPENVTVSALFRRIKETRGRTRKVSKHERAALGWEYPRPFSFVLKS